jgi:hypothetical protein
VAEHRTSSRREISRRQTRLVGFCVVAVGLSASAHPADMIYATLERPTLDARVEATLTFTRNTLGALAPSLREDGPVAPSVVDATVWDGARVYAGDERCRQVFSDVAEKDETLTVTARFECSAGKLKQVFSLLSLLSGGYKVVFRGVDRGQVVDAFAAGNEQTVVLPTPTEAPPPASRGLLGWIHLGMEHIFLGWDHLAFLAALLLVARGWKQLFGIVTAFTFAHSLTLGLTALEWVTLSPALQRGTEVAIALSIVVVAGWNLVAPDKTHRIAPAFLFGLIHGFGFATVLREYGLGASVAQALFGFNVGVELGQACVVGVLFPAILFSRRTFARVWVVKAASALLAAAGAYWLVERLLA